MNAPHSPSPDLSSIAGLRRLQTRSISPENFDGAVGGGGRATDGTGASCARDLGPGWKISPSVDIKAGETFELANIDGAGKITHIWITTHTDNWRTLSCARTGTAPTSPRSRCRTATSSATAGACSRR